MDLQLSVYIECPHCGEQFVEKMTESDIYNGKAVKCPQFSDGLVKHNGCNNVFFVKGELQAKLQVSKIGEPNAITTEVL